MDSQLPVTLPRYVRLPPVSVTLIARACGVSSPSFGGFCFFLAIELIIYAAVVAKSAVAAKSVARNEPHVCALK